MMPTSVSVELADVGKRYAGRALFKGLQARVLPGECLVITGNNGSGKSTLLKIIAGLVAPSTGAVHLSRDGKKLLAEDKNTCLGMVSPEVVLYSAMTGYENVNFFARLRGQTLGLKELSERLVQVGLNSQQHDLVSSYSTGMRQRLKFAILLAVEPVLWLLDEPSSNLDNEGKAVVSTLIEEAIKRQVTVVLATNEAWEASYATHQIALG